MKKTKTKPTINKTLKQSKKQLIKAKRPTHKKIFLSPASLFIFLCLGVILATSTIVSSAQTINISAVVPAKALTSPATITNLSNNQKLTTSPIKVIGNCPPNSYVVLVRNGYASGMAVCQNNSFQIETDLTPGSNNLLAQDYNLTNQAGPAGSSLRVIYVPATSAQPPIAQTIPAANSPQPPNPSTSTLPSQPAPSSLLLSATSSYKTFTTGETYAWQMTLSGGQPPYFVYVNWGDNTYSNFFFKADPTFTVEHHYQKSGIYTIIVSSIDSAGYKAVTQLSAVIKANPVNQVGLTNLNNNNPVANGLSIIKSKTAQNLLWFIWPTYIIIILMIISFWLGERRELKSLVAKHYLSKRTLRR